MKRLLLSIYFYERKKEGESFFDAWWQFAYTLEYIALGALISLSNLFLGVWGYSFNPIIIITLVILLFVFNLFFSKTLRHKYEPKIKDAMNSFQPYPIWALYVLIGLAIVLFLLSFSFF